MDRVLDIKELSALITDITDRIEKEIIMANRLGYLSKVLEKYNLQVEDCWGCNERLAKVLVIGDSQVNVNDLYAIIKQYQIDKDRFEFVLGYDKAKDYRMDTLEYNDKYCDVFVGPMPHKTTGMGDCSSIIAEMENHPENYPKLTKLISGEELKITKTNFEKALLNSHLMQIISA